MGLGLNLGLRLGAPALNKGVGVRTLDIAGPELVTNGQFNSDISGWNDGSSAGGAIAWQSPGHLRTTNTSGTARARQQVTVEDGERYAFAVRNVGSPSVAGAISIGTSAGGSQYTMLGGSTNPAIAQRVGISEFTAISAAAHIQMAAGVAGALDWDHATLRKLIATAFPIGTVFEDDFSVDGPILGRVTANGVPWRIIQTVNGTQVVPEVAGGKLTVTPNASGASASYPYLDAGDGVIAGIHCDLSWTGAGSVALISARKAGSRLLISDITRDGFHPVFTDTKLDIGVGTGSVTVIETVNYNTPAVTDGRVYPGVGFSLVGNTATFTLPDGQVIERTDSRFVAGECGVAEHYYQTPPTGGIFIEAVSMRLAA